MISIVLPTYNGEKFLSDSIQSIINQSYTDWELIVIDDCSQDSTNDIAVEYSRKDNRIKVFRNEHNLKLPASLNEGFSKTIGNYLTWTSDDNLYEPDALKKMHGVLKNDENCDFVFSRMGYIDGNGKNRGLSYVPLDVKELFYHNIVGASFMYTRKVYEDIGEYNTEKFLMEDYDYWLRIAKKYTIKYLPEVLYRYRQHDDSLTETHNRQVLEGKVKLLEEELMCLDLEKNIFRMIYRELAEASFSLERYSEMKNYLFEMKKISPDLHDVRKVVIISSKIGPTLSSLMKIFFKRKGSPRVKEHI